MGAGRHYSKKERKGLEMGVEERPTTPPLQCWLMTMLLTSNGAVDEGPLVLPVSTFHYLLVIHVYG